MLYQIKDRFNLSDEEIFLLVMHLDDSFHLCNIVGVYMSAHLIVPASNSILSLERFTIIGPEGCAKG